MNEPYNTPPHIESQLFIFVLEMTGVQVVGSRNLRLYNILDWDLHNHKVAISLNTAPTGATFIVDIHKNGTTLFTVSGNRPMISAAAFYGETTTINVPTWTAGQYLQVEVDQIGSMVAGSDLTVHILAS